MENFRESVDRARSTVLLADERNSADIAYSVLSRRSFTQSSVRKHPFKRITRHESVPRAGKYPGVIYPYLVNEALHK